jgi:hypothetical protein
MYLGEDFMDNAMEHMYWTIRCETEKCPGLHVVKYIGKYDPRGKIFTPPAATPETFEGFRCEVCSQVHTYDRKELTPRDLPAAPQPNFRPWF